MTAKNYCEDCGTSSLYHTSTWLDELTNIFLPHALLRFLPRKIDSFFEILLEKFFVLSRIASFKDDFTRADIQLRSSCFIEEGRKRGIKFRALRGPFGYTNHFQMEKQGKMSRFESLPLAEFLSKYGSWIVDDKEITKRHLSKGGFPVAPGKSFWFWQKEKAILYGKDELGFPLVVKPRGGSLSRHVTTDINDIENLEKAINKAISYSPVFIMEKFISPAFVFRATVIDFNDVFCVKQVPANVLGDGKSTIRELIDEKNSDPRRGKPCQKEFILNRIVLSERTEDLLKNKGYNFSSVPKKGEIVYLQKDSFLKLGGDLIEVTPKVHPQNLKLFRDIAKFFDIRVVGIDFLAQDISVPWGKQRCAVLELNSAPCIEMHHFPYSGEPQNVAGAIVDLVSEYYL